MSDRDPAPVDDEAQTEGDASAAPTGVEQQTRAPRWLVVTAILLAIVVVAGGTAAATLMLVAGDRSQPPTDAATSAAGVLGPEELAARYGDAIYRVETIGCGFEGSGTAFAVGDRHLVTNWHVVANDASPTLVARDGTRVPATVVGWTRKPDVAVLEVRKDLEVSLDWEDTADLREGQHITAMGFPAPALDFTVTPGTILSFQTEGDARQAIRTDGALDKGNSGGPALTDDGRVAGVVTEMALNEGGFQLVPLVYTADALRPSVERLLDGGSRVRTDCNAAGTYQTLPPGWEHGAVPSAHGYGDDPVLDELWDDCADGDLEACDVLFFMSPYGSEYEAFAMSCGDRGGFAFGTCALDGGQTRDVAADAGLDELADACEGGDMPACDELYWWADLGSDLEAIGDSCGGRTSGMGGACEWWAADQAAAEQAAEQTDAELAALRKACADGDMVACDELWAFAPSGSADERFGGSCGDRTSGQGGSCEFWQAEQEADAEYAAQLDQMASACRNGDMAACDELHWEAAPGSSHEQVAESCGGRTSGRGGDCSGWEYEQQYEQERQEMLQAYYDDCAAGDMNACDDLYYEADSGTEHEEFGSTCGGRYEPTYGECWAQQ